MIHLSMLCSVISLIVLFFCFFFSSRRRHTRSLCDWSSDVCSSDLVGIKPTLGMVSRAGIIPFAHSQDTSGPMARTVRDAAILLGVLTGADERDAVTVSSRTKGHSDYTRFLDAGGLKGARIGVARQYFGFNDATDRLMKDAIALIKS